MRWQHSIGANLRIFMFQWTEADRILFVGTLIWAAEVCASNRNLVYGIACFHSPHRPFKPLTPIQNHFDCQDVAVLARFLAAHIDSHSHNHTPIFSEISVMKHSTDSMECGQSGLQRNLLVMWTCAPRQHQTTVLASNWNATLPSTPQPDILSLGKQLFILIPYFINCFVFIQLYFYSTLYSS